MIVMNQISKKEIIREQQEVCWVQEQNMVIVQIISSKAIMVLITNASLQCKCKSSNNSV